MNLPQTVINNSIVTQSSTLFNPQPQYQPNTQWGNGSECPEYQRMTLQLSQYYNVFHEVPSTKTSWTFPNGCVSSNIVRFTGSPAPTYPVFSHEYKPTGLISVKRKSLTTNDEPQPSKIFITEEKMAARMSDMHISNEFISHAGISDLETSNVDANVDEVIECSSKTNSGPQLVVCDELKNLSKEMNSFIPEPLIPFEKPSTALVLWRPPKSYLNVVQLPPEEEYPTRSSVIITDITDRPDLDNNNISTVDFNTLLNPTSNDEVNMEVMEM